MTSVSFDQLVPEQRTIADHNSGTVLVLGGAGVGKTTTALWAARRELTEQGNSSRTIAGRRVLFVTFSRTAVAQIRNRAGGVLTGISDAVEIVTFHGLAYRLLCAFGRYIGHDGNPVIRGAARSQMGVSTDEHSLNYEELIPLALKLLSTPGPIADLVKSRWSLVVCDEFQDTDDDEWRLLECLGEHARLLLLADPNQMIYGFKDGVSESRLDAARARDDVVELTLPLGSHRDPSQMIPDAASEIRWRRFDTEPVLKAVKAGKLVVCTDIPDEDEDRARIITGHVAQLREEGFSTIGIYAKTNADTAGLSAGLTDCGLDHVPIGFGEAFGESLSAMVSLMKFSRGVLPWDDVGSALGIALTASVRSKNPPVLAVSLREGNGLPAEMERRIAELQIDLIEARDDVVHLSELIASAWMRIGISSGRRAWSRAGRSLVALAAQQHQSDSVSLLDYVDASVTVLRNESFVELDSGDLGAIQLMNFHQTKGREADAVILSYSSTDWYGRGGEPYEEASRVLYVSMTRARHRIVVLLPSAPHALVQPFTGLADLAGFQAL
ncbi:MAG: UvrD-helicase domain-containing protein [Acidimicrobiales bacterium]